MTPEPYDHVRAADGPVPPGVYRVVGVGGGRVTLLRVTDADGRRVNSGAVERVDRETLARAFESAENPDAGFSLASLVDPFSAYATALRHWLGI